MRVYVRLASVLLGATMLGSCGGLFGPYPIAYPPTALEFHQGGFGAVWHRITVDGDSVHVLRGTWWSAEYDSLSSRPTAEQWRRFWIATEESGVRAWRASYIRYDVVDGSSWGLRYELDGTRRASSGSNRYPRADGSGSNEMTQAYRRLLAAFEDLVGENLFDELRPWSP